MSALSGEVAVAPSYTSVQNTASVGPFTAETVTDTLTASLVNGETYMVTWTGNVFSSVAGDVATARIREDNISGTQQDSTDIPLPVANKSNKGTCRVEFVAIATGNKTFVATVARNSGTGNITRQAAGTIPKALLTIERKGS